MQTYLLMLHALSDTSSLPSSSSSKLLEPRMLFNIQSSSQTEFGVGGGGGGGGLGIIGIHHTTSMNIKV